MFVLKFQSSHSSQGTRALVNKLREDNIMKSQIFLIIFLFCVSASMAHAVSFPLRASANGRYLIDQQGQPFFYHGDTPWFIFGRLTRAEAITYLDDRRAKGVNAINVHILWGDINLHGVTDVTKVRNREGHLPFTGELLATPNPSYFDYVEWLVARAAERGIVVALSPAWQGYKNGTWWQHYTVARCQAYGRYLGQRFASHNNIIWVQGGDSNPVGKESSIRALANEIRTYAPKHLQVYHGAPETSSASHFGGDAWLTINGAYSYNPTHQHVSAEYGRVPIRPIPLLETDYEDSVPANVSSVVRRQAYFATLSGACGHTYGHYLIYTFGTGWQQALQRPGAQHMVHLKNLFTSVAWYRLVPDLNHQTVTAGYGSGLSYVASARADDGSFVLAYVPPTGSSGMTVNMSRIAGSVAAQWFNPTNGTYATITGSPFANSGSRVFTTPGNNGTGSTDWVLVLRATTATANIPPSVSLTAPANTSTFTAPANVTVSANASDSNGTVSKVDFYRNGALIGTDTTSPYALVMSSLAAGTYSLTAKATDNGNLSTTSSTVSITVSNTTGPVTIIPVEKDRARHDAFVQIAQAGNLDVVFWGDSITDWWRSTGLSVWNQYFAPLKAANFGISGDQTQHVIWRVRNGELSGPPPKVAVLMIGINNLRSGNTPSDTSLGIKTIIGDIQRISPGTKVLLLSVLPVATLRSPIDQINSTISGYANGTTIVYVNVGAKFLASNGSILPGVYSDGLHLTQAGYQIWADAIIGTLISMRGTNTPPSVSLTSPANGSTFTAPANITVSANASDSNGTISKVEFYRNGVIVGTDTTSPYSWIMSSLAAGSYSLSAKATDNAGAVTTSGAVAITVSASTPTPTPTVLMPPTTTSPAEGATLSGTSATVSWNSVSGAASYLIRCQDLSGSTPVDSRNTGGTTFLYIDKYTSTSITMKVVSGHSYRFWIHSAKAGFSYADTTSWSAKTVRLFSVTAATPTPTSTVLAPPTMTSPTEGAKLSGPSATVSWNSVSGAASYLVRCQDLTGTTPADLRNTGGNGTTFLYIDKYTSTSITMKVVSGHSYRFWIHSAKAGFSYADATSWSAGTYRLFSVTPAMPTGNG
jgi:lysophospholipase L1-like esterase